MSEQTPQAKAAELVALMHEFLVADFVGAITRHGEAEVLAAMQEAIEQMVDWRADHPDAVPDFVKLQIIAGLEVITPAPSLGTNSRSE